MPRQLVGLYITVGLLLAEDGHVLFCHHSVRPILCLPPPLLQLLI